jgi:hypothetical protein
VHAWVCVSLISAFETKDFLKTLYENCAAEAHPNTVTYTLTMYNNNNNNNNNNNMAKMRNLCSGQ